jgi:hypothetical protein
VIGRYGKNAEPLLVPGTLRGYRRWVLLNGTLVGPVSEREWPKGENTANCWTLFPCSGPSPTSTCHCGFYAKYQFDNLEYLGVKGVVEASGRVFLGTEGFRAEKARVVALVTDSRDPLKSPAQVRLCAKKYGADFFESAAEMLLKYPPQDVSSLLSPALEPVR